MDISALPLLSAGAHRSINAGMCVMEAVAFVAGEPWSDRPQCACPVIAAFLRAWNDALPDNERNALLRPLITRLVGTKADTETEYRRAIMALDWLLRVHVPAWLRLAGLTGHADAIASLPELTDFAQCKPLVPMLNAARSAAEAAWDAAGKAVGDAAKEAACDAAAAAAATAAGGAAWPIAWDAANVAANVAGDVAAAAAGAAAWDALNDTRVALQKSALGLVNRMIDAR